MIQIAMAQKIAEIEQKMLEQVVLRSTAFYRIFGLDWSFDPMNPIWETYLDGLHLTTDPVQYTYDYYLQRYPTIPTSAEEQTHWGCFAYNYNATTKKIKLHFGDYDQSAHGPLSHLRIDQRKEELRAMFQEIQHTHPDALWVVGGSWLYNWESYTRLFPPSFGQNAKPQGKTFPARSRKLEPILAQRVAHPSRIDGVLSAKGPSTRTRRRVSGLLSLCRIVDGGSHLSLL